MDITLERKPLPLPEVAVEVGVSLRELGLRAEEELHYARLSQDIQHVSREKEARVARALQDLEIEPFTAKSVAAYMAAKQREETWLRRRLGRVGGVLVAIAVACAFVAGSVYHNDRAVAYALITACGIAIITGFARAIAGQWSWQRSWLAPDHGYSEPIPEYVLHKALQIKAALPEAILFVEQLVESNQGADPFMGFRYDGKDYYFEVWQEPAFEAEVLTGS